MEHNFFGVRMDIPPVDGIPVTVVNGYMGDTKVPMYELWVHGAERFYIWQNPFDVSQVKMNGYLPFGFIRNGLASGNSVILERYKHYKLTISVGHGTDSFTGQPTVYFEAELNGEGW